MYVVVASFRESYNRDIVPTITNALADDENDDKVNVARFKSETRYSYNNKHLGGIK